MTKKISHSKIFLLLIIPMCFTEQSKVLKLADGILLDTTVLRELIVRY